MALRIKDNVDLKQLEKFGFKPFYDCDTGEIIYWHKTIYDRYFSSREYREYTIKIAETKFCYEAVGLSKKKKEIKNRIEFKRAEKGNVYELFFDTLFDLIQAGLVEKREE